MTERAKLAQDFHDQGYNCAQAVVCGGGRYDGLVEELGGKVVKIIFLMELAGLKGRERLKDYDVASVIRYDGK